MPFGCVGVSDDWGLPIRTPWIVGSIWRGDAQVKTPYLYFAVISRPLPELMPRNRLADFKAALQQQPLRRGCCRVVAVGRTSPSIGQRWIGSRLKALSRPPKRRGQCSKLACALRFVESRRTSRSVEAHAHRKVYLKVSEIEPCRLQGPNLLLS